MSSANSDPEQAWVERQLLADGSKRGWQRRSVGKSRAAALAEVPRAGTMQTMLPIVPMRALQRHIQARKTSQAIWLRRAIVEHYLREGGDPTVAAGLLEVAHEHRTREVFGDHVGQDRRRVGRRGRGS